MNHSISSAPSSHRSQSSISTLTPAHTNSFHKSLNPFDTYPTVYSPTTTSSEKHTTCTSPYTKQDDNGRFIVHWLGDNDQGNPKNWPMSRKWVALALMSVLTFVSPISSAMINPAVPEIEKDLDFSEGISGQVLMSIYGLGAAFGPLFIGPMSELYGRKWVLVASILVYVAFSLGCGFAQDSGVLVACRFIAGMGGSGPVISGAAVIGDMWEKHTMGKATAIYMLCPLVGPAVGPILGGFISVYYTWRFCFFLTAIIGGVVLVLTSILLRETSGAVILRRRAKQLTKSTGKPHTVADMEIPISVGTVFSNHLIRPFKLLFTQPIIIYLALYNALVYGVMHFLLTTFAKMWRSVYNEPVQITSLNYISVSVGYVCSAIMSSLFIDRIYNYLSRTKGTHNEGRPEFRLPILFVAMIVLSVGLFWYGWSAQAHVFWILPNIGTAIASFGAASCYTIITVYIVDVYSRYAASALASVAFLRSICGFVWPLFAPYLIDAIGYGWSSTIFGALAIVLGLPFVWVFWRYGASLRAKSPYSADQDNDNE